MDFPKSVPGVGLVGGEFGDENQATGQAGSLIPAAWGNAVTRELLSVIEAAGLEPDEARADQLLEAIRALVPERSAFARRTGTNSLPASAFGIYALADGGAAATVTLPSTADLAADTELLLFASHANTAAVQVKAAVDQTIQGPVALMGVSTTAFMLPLGGDWVRLRSEKAQARWVVVQSYAATERARVSALEAVPKPIGYQQVWTNMLASRSLGVTFTNNTDRTRSVSITALSSSVSGTMGAALLAFVDSREISRGTFCYGPDAPTSIYFTVGPRKSYRVVIGSGAGALLSWEEEL